MKKLFKLPVRFLWVFAAIIILQACYPGDSIPITDLDTTTTLYNSDDLATAPTSAAIVWEVVQIEDDTEDDLPYDGEQDEAILNTTLQELVKLYKEQDSVVIISETANPPYFDPANYPTVKVVVLANLDPIPSVSTIYAPSVVLRKETIVYTYPGYGWWGGYPGYGGCYYCGYPSYGTTSYQTGTVVLEMYDLRKIVGGVIPPDYDMSWIAAMKGLLSNNQTPSAARSRVISGIEKAFEQSPYLDPNK